MADSSKISPYNLSDCKNTTDDALQNYLNGLKFKQSHYHTDVKLAFGYAAVIICAITFAYDYKLGFEATKYWTAGTVTIYFLLNGAFTYWLWFVEKDVVYNGDAKGRKVSTNGQTSMRMLIKAKVVISSWTKKLEPNYRLKVRYTGSSGSNDWQESEVSAPFMQWFTADGVFVAQPFQRWLASSVPVIGEVDPKNATGPSQADLGASSATASIL
ncbi:putative signal peptidase complex subunit spc2 [Elsinoe australis]|uniref:Signal peptidase complex subunit 2 n=1 Tax=Elsinoe australis TaxID=40998 RepID=A0A4U7B848_9PEZI|nr:putative signal peptidase complex subunit spc2 [Elsinoe australis]